MGRTRTERIHGPYRARKRWRILHVDREGRQTPHSFATQAEAEQAIADLRAALEHERLTVGKLIDMYRDHQKRKGNKPGSIRTTRYRLRAMFPNQDLSVAQITRRRAQRLYDHLCDATKPDTHRNTLAEVKTFCRWAVRRGYWRTSPFEEVEGIGRRTRGKEQLTADEARALVAACVADGSDAGDAVLCSLLLGMRSTEITSLIGRDLVAATQSLRVRDAKTTAGRRTVAVPDGLWQRLAARVGEPTEELFPGRDRHWLRQQAHRLCTLAGVPVVCPHGLRGTHASLATEAGVAGHVVAATLGHTSFEGMTAKAYAQPGAVARARQAKVLEVLEGKEQTNESI